MTTETLNEITIAPIRTNSAVEFQTKSNDLHLKAKSLVIKNQPHLESAVVLRNSIKDMARELDTERKKITSPLDSAKKAVMDLFRPATSVLETAERIVNDAIVKYNDEQERIRREQEEKLRKEAEAKEAKRKAELEERARKAAEAGKEEKAEALRQQAEEYHVTAPTIAPTVQKVDGLSFREDWGAEVVDILELVQAISIGKAPINFIQPNTQVLNAQAKATKDSLKFPGVKFTSKKVPVRK